MVNTKQNGLIKALVGLSFMVMITVNALANALPIGGLNTGEVSDSFPNLFAPQGLTFSIWGLIYLLVLGFVLFHLGLFRNTNDSIEKNQLLDKVGLLFIIKSLANASWIFAWHYQIMPLTLFFMFTILLCLILITLAIHRYHQSLKLNSTEKFFLRLPFSIYFGWITVATIANITAFLVRLGWNGWGIEESLWTVIILIVGALIGIATMLRFKDIAYALVFVWAYAGIWMKHIRPGPEGFSGLYPGVINISLVCIIAFLVIVAYLLFQRTRSHKV
jgi:hypothetical protein